MSRGLRFAAATALLWVAGATSLEAASWQPDVPSPDSTRAENVGCLHGAPPPTCSTFWIVEFQASTGWRVGENQTRPDPFSDDGFTWYEWNVGHMINLGDRWALGGAVSLGNGSNDVFNGVRVRMRRWIRPQMSLEVEGGMAKSDGGHGRYRPLTAPSAGVRFNIQDKGSLFLRYDAFGTPEGTRHVGFDHEEVPWGREAMLRAGVGLGGKPALVGMGVVVLGFALLLAALANTYGSS